MHSDICYGFDSGTRLKIEWISVVPGCYRQIRAILARRRVRGNRNRNHPNPLLTQMRLTESRRTESVESTSNNKFTRKRRWNTPQHLAANPLLTAARTNNESLRTKQAAGVRELSAQTGQGQAARLPLAHLPRNARLGSRRSRLFLLRGEPKGRADPHPSPLALDAPRTYS